MLHAHVCASHPQFIRRISLRISNTIDHQLHGIPVSALETHLQSLVCQHLCNGVQGNCSAAVPASMLSAEDAAARKPGQCALVIDHALLTVIHGRLWMDSLFIALRHSSRTPGVNIILCGDSKKTSFDDNPAGGSLWLTRSVVQGQAAPGLDPLSCTGIAVYSKFAGNGVVLTCCTYYLSYADSVYSYVL